MGSPTSKSKGTSKRVIVGAAVSFTVLVALFYNSIQTAALQTDQVQQQLAALQGQLAKEKQTVVDLLSQTKGQNQKLETVSEQQRGEIESLKTALKTETATTAAAIAAAATAAAKTAPADTQKPTKTKTPLKAAVSHQGGRLVPDSELEIIRAKHGKHGSGDDVRFSFKGTMSLETVKAAMKEAGTNPLVFLVRGEAVYQHVLIGLLEPSIIKSLVQSDGKTRPWKTIDDSMPHKREEVRQGPFKLEKFGKDCFEIDDPDANVHVLTRRQWNFDGKFSLDAYGFMIKGPAAWDCMDKSLQDFYLSNSFYSHSATGVVSPPVMPMMDWYFNQAYSSSEAAYEWNVEQVQGMIDGSSSEANGHQAPGATYIEGSLVIRNALIEHPVLGLHGLILGSLSPWVEGICLGHGSLSTTTAEYSIIESSDPRARYISIFDLMAKPRQFDYVLTYSSLEHDGLGRFGDPWNPNGDMEQFQRIHDFWLKPGGKFYMAIPTGADVLWWNSAHSYGRKRWGRIMALRDWEFLGVYGAQVYAEDWSDGNGKAWDPTPFRTYDKDGTTWKFKKECGADCIFDFAEKHLKTHPDDLGETYQPLFVFKKKGNEVSLPTKGPFHGSKIYTEQH